MDYASLTAAEAAEAIRSGAMASVDLVSACIERIRSLEDSVGAWAFFDPDHALAQAQHADSVRQEGGSTGPLHGVPVGVKDIFDTSDMPTENGTPLHSGRRPLEDAAVVSLLRQAGAVIMGKTVTTELAVYSPGKTRNPHDSSRTPGGSSSGSAAAVAASMVPVAVGSQTNGSVVRPASFCGVYGFKPSHGLIPRCGALRQSRPLDHVGVFARTLGDVALTTEALIAFDPRDPDSRPMARPVLTKTACEPPPVTPRLAFVKSPYWDRTDADTRGGFDELLECLREKGQVEEVELEAIFAHAVDAHRSIMEADLAHSFRAEYERGKARLSAKLIEMLERGRKVTAMDYHAARGRTEVLGQLLDGHFDFYDAILTPAAPGEALPGLDSTGDPVFCTIWTLCGAPAISLPLMRGAHGMPIGVQLVGRKGNDGRLLRTASWLVQAVCSPP